MQTIVLASSSPYRRQLLEKLQLPFSHYSPQIDETPLNHESPKQLVTRLAIKKAKAVSHTFPDSLIIGSDQVACLNGTPLGKPGSHQQAIAQLESFSGQCVEFLTSLCLLNTESQQQQVTVERYRVYFRQLNFNQIERYIIKEQPFDCAGSFKSEGLGISLFQKLEGNDPNTLVGLPLIKLVSMLAKEGIEIP
jgi:MAF protein